MMTSELLYDAIDALRTGEFPPEPPEVAAARKALGDLFERLPDASQRKRNDRRAQKHYEGIIDGYSTLIIERAADLGRINPKDYGYEYSPPAASGAAR